MLLIIIFLFYKALSFFSRYLKKKKDLFNAEVTKLYKIDGLSLRRQRLDHMIIKQVNLGKEGKDVNQDNKGNKGNKGNHISVTYGPSILLAMARLEEGIFRLPYCRIRYYPVGILCSVVAFPLSHLLKPGPSLVQGMFCGIDGYF